MLLLFPLPQNMANTVNAHDQMSVRRVSRVRSLSGTPLSICTAASICSGEQ